ncbi:MAG: tRNA lysidine(34) synthetase TilS [Phycisphaerales bacterium]|nr:tRNA lysidine(34) synthetase TilS [Phycisphaerales bacterium]
MLWDAFIQRLADWLYLHDALGRGRGWTIGVSGGPDSLIMLHALTALNERDGLGWRLTVAHLDHAMRADAEADASFVAAEADRLGLDAIIERLDLPPGSALSEDAARAARYEFFERVALTTDSEFVAVAHHADDNAETVLHRICRGTGLRGLSGMPARRALRPHSRVTIIRPLLWARRAEVEAICADRGLTPRNDATNQTGQFTRGRIRNTVMPLLAEHINPQIREAILRLAEQARWVDQHLEEAAARTYDALMISERPGLIALHITGLRRKPRIIQAQVVRRAVAALAGADVDLSFSHFDAALRIVEGGSGKETHLPGSVVVRRVYDRLEFRLHEETADAQSLEPTIIAMPGVTPLPSLTGRLRVDVVDVAEDLIAELRANARPNEEWLDLSRIRPPLVLRGRRDGERFWPLGAPGSKTINDFFSDEKVAPELRARVGVLCDQEGPIWVIPLRIDERVKLRPTTTRALRLRLENHLDGPAPA